MVTYVSGAGRQVGRQAATLNRTPDLVSYKSGATFSYFHVGRSQTKREVLFGMQEHRLALGMATSLVGR